jgi:hypothetical protein
MGVAREALEARPDLRSGLARVTCSSALRAWLGARVRLVHGPDSRSRPTPLAKALLVDADRHARSMGESAHALDGHGTRVGGAEPALPPRPSRPPNSSRTVRATGRCRRLRPRRVRRTVRT